MGAQRKSAIPRNTEACRTSQTLLYHKGGRLYGGWEACGGGLERKEGCQGVLIQVPYGDKCGGGLQPVVAQTWKHGREVGADTKQTHHGQVH